jgi:hypothetical protein
MPRQPKIDDAGLPIFVAAPGESPVDPGTLADEEGLDGLQYVTGEVPYQSQMERLLAEDNPDIQAADSRDWEPPEELQADPVASDERDDRVNDPDLDRQGRRGAGDVDWQGQMQADSGRHRPDDGSRRRR